MGHALSHSISSRELYLKEKEIREYKKEDLLKDIENEKHDFLISLLLDSSLITPTHNKKFVYMTKIIECGNYIQVYYFNNKKVKKGKKEKEDKKILYDNDYLFNKDNYKKELSVKQIEFKNINRSKFQLQRYVKANEDIFKTFITLTFADNVTDINIANKKFHIWTTKIKSIYSDFKYICVPEFQKRGSVHYHLLTNLELDKEYIYTRRNKTLSCKLVVPQTKFTDKQLKKLTQEQRDKMYDIKYWSYGFSNIQVLKNINIVGYISKYMTKDIDNRLYGHRRYFGSSSLKKPSEYFIDFDTNDIFELRSLLYHDYLESYSNSYLDKFGCNVDYVEYKRK